MNLLRDAELIQKAAELSQSTTEKKGPSLVAAQDHPASPAAAVGIHRSIPEWHAQTVYHIGDVVSYGGARYVCIQSHTSQSDWEPPRVPALWVRAADDGDDVPPEPGPGDEENLFAYRMRSLQLPVDEAFKSILATSPESSSRSEEPSLEDTARELLRRHRNLRDSISELNAVATSDIVASETEQHPGSGVDDEFSVTKQLKEQLRHVSQLRTLNIEQFRAAAARSGTAPEPGPVIKGAAVAAAESGTDPLILQDGAGSASAVALVRELMASPPGLTGAAKFVPAPAGETAPKLKESTKLSAKTMAVLESHNIKHYEVPLPGRPTF